MEIIKVRAARDAGVTIRNVVQSLKSDGDLQEREIRVFRNAFGDIAIHMFSPGNVTEWQESSLGVQLAAALSECGLINHTVWMEEV